MAGVGAGQCASGAQTPTTPVKPVVKLIKCRNK